MAVNLSDYGLNGKREPLGKAVIAMPDAMAGMCPMCHQALPTPEMPEEESNNIKIEIEIEVPVGEVNGNIS
jgi:hypothetical protein